ncbi:hypothetical protein ACFC1I_18390 [Microbacterium sp. NPDC056044]|uniref:S10 family serine carboxypeptidase-like protein n=1 Tax=Microbacterium sp. NPDC056044 TaxID=3345690 RepID=UPI0035D87A38
MTAAPVLDAVSVHTSRHRVTAAGEEVAFAAIAERVSLIDERDAAPLGDAWTFAYVREPVDASRPVLFLFNGGPGCASPWLHLSGLAPWRAAVPERLDAAPDLTSALQPSADSLIDAADLVVIDPVDTGFSRLPADVDPALISGADRDAELTAQIVRGWLDRHDRVASPVFLLGESYGTIRASLTATALRDRGTHVAGVAMLGQCVNAQETTQRAGNAAGFVAAVPLFAAVAWHHGLSAHPGLSLDEVVDAAHEFAVTDYAAALSRGTEPADVVDRLAGFTGLAPDALRARRLRIDKEEYRTLLLADRGEVLGLTDARYTLPGPPPGVWQPPLDAADVRIDAVFSAAVHALLTHELGLPSAPYRFATPAHERWNYLEASAIGRFGGSALPSPFAIFDYPAHLAAYLRANPAGRLFFGTGHFDTLTTVGSLQHLLTQYGLPRERIAEGRYPAGHMMYTDPASLAALAGDLRTFLRG